MRRGGGCIYIRGPSKRKRTGFEFLPESFWTRFGAGTAIVNTGYDPPVVKTYADLGREKKRRQEECLEAKRRTFSRTEVRPIYVWVFHCPGLSGMYEGWWTYLIGRHGWDSGKYLDRNPETITELMELFPLGDETLFGPALTHREWQIRFARAYCCRHPDGTPRRHAGRIQGKALLWAEFHGGVFRRLIGRAYLPVRNVMGT